MGNLGLNRVALLGSTGSIGTQTLEVARHLREQVKVVALASGRNAQLLSLQLNEFQPRLYHSLIPEEVASGHSVLTTPEEIVADDQVDTVIVATAGSAGLKPTLVALAHGKTVALANKEVMVMAGSLVMESARRTGAAVVPIDSEHNAIWQCLRGEERASVQQILLTASGGPFRTYPVERLKAVTAREALAHPVWPMGPKVTIDSATLMNKGLEVIEAHWLFDMPYEQIRVLLHPECLIHSMVEFVDGSIKAQLSSPDMTLPIQYALTYPDRVRSPRRPFAWDTLYTLTFTQVDTNRFPGLRIAREAGYAGRTYPAALCGADDAAVTLFLRGAIEFPQIAQLVEHTLAAHSPCDATTLEAVVGADAWARDYVMKHYTSICST